MGLLAGMAVAFIVLIVGFALVVALIGTLIGLATALAPFLVVGAVGYVLFRALSGRPRRLPSMPSIDLRRRGPGAMAEPVEPGIFCPSCEQGVSRNWATCPHCGYRKYVAPDLIQRRCATCGTELQKGWQACPYCSTRIDVPLMAPAPAAAEYRAAAEHREVVPAGSF